MKKYRTALKLEVVQRFLAGEGGSKLLARQQSVSIGKRLMRWWPEPTAGDIIWCHFLDT